MNAIEKLLYDKKKKILTLFRSFNHSIFDFIVSKEAKKALRKILCKRYSTKSSIEL